MAHRSSTVTTGTTSTVVTSAPDAREGQALAAIYDRAGVGMKLEPERVRVMVRQWQDAPRDAYEQHAAPDLSFHYHEYAGVPNDEDTQRALRKLGYEHFLAQPYPVFVYGTLRHGQRSHHLFGDAYTTITPGRVYGCSVYGEHWVFPYACENPDPDVFLYAAATVKACMDATHRLKGENYVLWGGREGYETLLNTDLARERQQAGRFLQMVVEYKHRIGFSGTILIEPKPQEPTKHQYDYDVATVYGFLKDFGLEDEVRVNIECGHAVLAGHSFEHEIALATSLGIFGSIDMNRNDYQSGWDTDQFPNNVPEVSLAYYEILKAGGFTTGGTNFDAKLRRQSLDPEDLILAHAGAMDVCARGLMAAAAMLKDGGLEEMRATRYAGWGGAEAKEMLEGDLASIANRVKTQGINPSPVSGQQERLENWINRFV